MALTDYTYDVGRTTRNTKYPCLMGISKRITQSAKNRHAYNVMRANHGNGLQQLRSMVIQLQKYRIQVKQNKLLKLILSRDGQTPTIFIHSDFNILKVWGIYKYNMLNFANTCVMGRLPENFKTCYIIKVVLYAIRSTGSLDVIPCRTGYGAKTVKVNGAVLWSNIHRNIREWRNMQDLKTSCWNTIYIYKCGEVVIIIYLYCKMQDVIIWKKLPFWDYDSELCCYVKALRSYSCKKCVSNYHW